MATVAINGLGRIGRGVLREGWGRWTLDLVNEPAADAQQVAHLLQHDSIYGRFSAAVAVDTRSSAPLRIGDQQISVSSSRDLAQGPWAERDLDLVIDCSGAFRSADALAPYFELGVPRVLVSAPVAPASPEVANLVHGVNSERFDPAQHRIVSASSCTTNCLAPVVAVLREHLGIRRGTFTTLHAVTNTQRVLDGFHKDPRRARASALSMIPTSTGSARAIFDIFPDLEGCLDGMAVRIPLTTASLTDCTFELERSTTPEAVNALFTEAAEQRLRGIMAVEHEPLVSVDYTGRTESCVIDALSTRVTAGTCLRVMAWYDNEMGYVHRMLDLADQLLRT